MDTMAQIEDNKTKRTKKRIVSIFGTRPEAIKMAPLVKALDRHPDFESIVIVTAQHREMLDQVLELFEITPDYDLNIMRQGQSLFDVTSDVLQHLDRVLDECQPDMVCVHGDTTTTFTASLAAYYKQIPVAHIEAGLRSGNLYSPFPEEANRKLTGVLAALHLAPTIQAKSNLIKEGVNEDSVFVTGNTVIDALLETIKKADAEKCKKNAKLSCENSPINDRIVLVTAHRRENHGEPLKEIFQAILDIHNECKDVSIVFPVHKNPKVSLLAQEMLSGKERIILTEPLEYEAFSWLISQSELVLTDSGGIQEEAPALGKPVLVLRDNTERPEAVEAGTVLLVGTKRENIYKNVKKLLTDRQRYDKMAKAVNPYGDGHACQRIVETLEYYYQLRQDRPGQWQK